MTGGRLPRVSSAASLTVRVLVPASGGCERTAASRGVRVKRPSRSSVTVSRFGLVVPGPTGRATEVGDVRARDVAAAASRVVRVLPLDCSPETRSPTAPAERCARCTTERVLRTVSGSTRAVRTVADREDAETDVRIERLPVTETVRKASRPAPDSRVATRALAECPLGPAVSGPRMDRRGA